MSDQMEIEIGLTDSEVAITLWSESGSVLAIRKIGLKDAFNLGLLMVSERPEEALNFETKSGVSLQIENDPYSRAWITLPIEKHKDFFLLLEGNNISYLGRGLWNMSRAGICNNRASLDQCRFRYRVSQFYQDGEKR